MGNVFKVKHGLSQPSKTDLNEYELGYCTSDGRLYINSEITHAEITSPTEGIAANSIKIKIDDIFSYVKDETTEKTIKKFGAIPVENIYGKIPAEKISGVIPIENGGTGATNSSNALINLGAAPKSHASAATTYGKGSNSKYGHVKLSSAIDEDSGNASGIAATPYAVKAVNDSLTHLLGGKKIITGSATVEYGPTSKDVTVSFGHTYNSPPVVLVSQVFDNANIIVKNNKITTTGFTTAVAGTFSTSGTRAFNWIAIGT